MQHSHEHEAVAHFKAELRQAIARVADLLREEAGIEIAFPCSTGEAIAVSKALGYDVSLKSVAREISRGTVGAPPMRDGYRYEWDLEDVVEMLCWAERGRKWIPRSEVHVAKMTCFEIADGDARLAEAKVRAAERTMGA